MTRFTKSRSRLFLLAAAHSIVAPAEARERPYKPHSARTCGIHGYRHSYRGPRRTAFGESVCPGAFSDGEG